MTYAKEWLKIVCLAVLLAMLLSVAPHLPGWCKAGDNLQDRGQRIEGNVQVASERLPVVTANLQAASENLKAISETARGKAESIDVASLNESLQTVRKIAGDLHSITGDPEVQKLVYMILRHTDRTVNNVDNATQDTRKEQKNTFRQTAVILDGTQQSIEETRQTIKAYGDLARNLQPAVSHANSLTEHADSTASMFDLPHHVRWLWHKLRREGGR